MKSTLKVGDKLLCKRDMSNNSKHKKLFFVRNQWYTINRCVEYGGAQIVDVVKNKRNTISFVVNGKYEFGRLFKLSRYFYTEKEIRKLKLLRLGSWD
jgi:hypothetical protein